MRGKLPCFARESARLLTAIMAGGPIPCHYTESRIDPLVAAVAMSPSLPLLPSTSWWIGSLASPARWNALDHIRKWR